MIEKTARFVCAGDMMEQKIVASHLPGLRSQLAPLEEMAAAEAASSGGSATASGRGSGACRGKSTTWLAKACAALGEGAAAAAQGRIGARIEVAERELPKAMERLYVEMESELDVQDWELAPRSFAMPGASEAKKSTAKDWAAGAAALGREDYHGDQEEGKSEEEGESSDEEAELEQLMQVRACETGTEFSRF
eukprot:COSAG06_NODE_12137_length_1419_cov_1.550758_2_plen_193_part_00